MSLRDQSLVPRAGSGRLLERVTLDRCITYCLCLKLVQMVALQRSPRMDACGSTISPTGHVSTVTRPWVNQLLTILAFVATTPILRLLDDNSLNM
mmetsp:Transcript_105837/g.210355  ORF Transcript_105837/g.210355 Transcript_105837/m.210355 type:complete len:95 (+) Transcript_105837:1209-1493(+)